MYLQDLTLKQFLEKTAANEPVPGGGSVSALHGAIASSLGEMLANLTIGKKKYLEVEDIMKLNSTKFADYRHHLLNDIDRDSDAYSLVSDAFKLPKETDDEKTVRDDKIQEASKMAAVVPMEVAVRCHEMLDLITETTLKGNKNAVTDGLVAMMTCRTAILGALLNVRINLSTIKDEEFVREMMAKCDSLESDTVAKEQDLIQKTMPAL